MSANKSTQCGLYNDETAHHGYDGYDHTSTPLTNNQSNLSNQWVDKNNEKMTQPTKLWSGTAVGMITFFLGFPGGLALASLNWFRMGQINKAILHLSLGALGFLALVLLPIQLPEAIETGFFLILNLAILFFLRKSTQEDIAAFRVQHPDVKTAHWLSAILVAIAGWILLFVFAAFIVIILTLFGVPV